MSATASQISSDVLALAKRLEADNENSSLRFHLLSRIDELHRSVRKTSDTPYRDYADIARLGAAATLLQHGVIQALPDVGFISAKALSQCTTLEEPTIIRLMRYMTSQGILELGREQEPRYAHTHLSRHWQQKGGPEHTLLMAGLAKIQLGDYLNCHDVKAVEDPAHCPAAWSNGTEGQDYFASISQDAVQLATFDHAMQYSEDIFPILGIYPFEDLAKHNIPDREVLIVDIGGGRGQALLAIKDALPELRGHLILQDRPDVLGSVSQVELGSIEKMVHDFFTPQPVKGARIYYIRRTTHDWDDASVLEIFKHTASAMSTESRLLVNDLLIPERAVPGTDLTAYWMDYAVMMIGGRERTEAELVELLEMAGLEHVKTWKMEVSAYAVIEAKVKSV